MKDSDESGELWLGRDRGYVGWGMGMKAVDNGGFVGVRRINNFMRGERRGWSQNEMWMRGGCVWKRRFMLPRERKESKLFHE